MEKNKPAWLLHITYKNKFTRNGDLNVKGKTMKLREKNTEKKEKNRRGFCVLGVKKVSFIRT